MNFLTYFLSQESKEEAEHVYLCDNLKIPDDSYLFGVLEE